LVNTPHKNSTVEKRGVIDKIAPLCVKTAHKYMSLDPIFLRAVKGFQRFNVTSI